MCWIIYLHGHEWLLECSMNFVLCDLTYFTKGLQEEVATTKVHPRLDLVNVIVRPFLFTKLSLFTISSLDKE